MAAIPQFKQSTIETLSQIIGETNSGLTNAEIHRLLLQAQIDDEEQSSIKVSKHVRLYNAFVNELKKHYYSNNIVAFIQLFLDPARYVGKAELFESRRQAVNKQLAFEGLEIDETGHAVALKEKASRLQDIDLRVKGFKNKLEQRNVHSAIVAYCRAELIADNYFHAVLEANKGLFQRIRDISGVDTDGNTLIEQVFSSNPVVIINNFITPSEKNEHTGFCNLLKGLCSMFRNTLAHEPKIEWPMSEQDALEVLSIISYCHRRLDHAQRIRIA
jgi:uncharacterized protein (TIGR02391 family)